MLCLYLLSLLGSEFVTVMKPKWTLACFLWADLWCLFLLSKSFFSKRCQCFVCLQTRVTCPPSNERNYHVFYELLFGITQEERGIQPLFFMWMVISFKPWSYVAVPIFFLIVKLHLQGYSVQSLAYLNRCSIPYNVDEEDYQVKFEKWRVCRLESVILVFIVDRGMIQLAWGGGARIWNRRGCWSSLLGV